MVRDGTKVFCDILSFSRKNPSSKSAIVSPFSKWIAVKMPEGSVARTFASGEGTEQYPFIIKTAGQLKLMAYLVNKTNEIKNTQAILATDQDEIDKLVSMETGKKNGRH